MKKHNKSSHDNRPLAVLQLDFGFPFAAVRALLRSVKKMKTIILLFFAVFSLSCKQQPREIKNSTDALDESESDSPYVKQTIIYFDTYKSGHPDKALKAMLDEVNHTLNAKEPDITPFWKNQALAFTKTRIYMILLHLNRNDEAQEYLNAALVHINLWMKEGGREPIDASKLIESVVAADQSEQGLPWHPKTQTEQD